MEQTEDMPGILSKKTNFIGSVSLTDAEFKQFCNGEYGMIRVSSTSGKHIRDVAINSVSLKRMMSRAKLLLVKDNPENPHYWVVNL